MTIAPLILLISSVIASPADLSAARAGDILVSADKSVTIDSLAVLCAPVLWFSSDEPLLPTNGGDASIPAKLPFLPGPEAPTVYYYVDGVSPSTALEFGKWNSIEIKFYFYYPRDVGGGGHLHDIEGAVVTVLSEQRGSEYGVYISRVEALAHGIRGYTNILDLSQFNARAPISLPLTLLVEEGKHASCPDRNADGLYTPGFDTNRRVNDAWGVRDVFGSGRFAASYNSWMTKTRKPRDKVWPPNARSRSEQIEYVGYVQEYNLRWISKSDWESKAVDDKLKGFLRKNHVGQNERAFRWQLPPVYYRQDLGDMVGMVVPWWFIHQSALRDELPIFGGNLGLKMDFGVGGNDRVCFGLFYVPSLTRWSDWYLEVGLDAETNVATRLALEGGWQFRPVNPNWRIINQLVLRVGARTLVHDYEFQETRLVFEVGIAPSI